MKIQFDGNQDYQLDAIRAVVDVFDGQPLAVGPHEARLDAARGDFFSEIGVGNQLLLTDEKILGNLQAVQKGNDLPVRDREG
ncbi:MAG: hypothetical protein ACRD21_19095 [Vicinamibacteria bacterium]